MSYVKIKNNRLSNKRLLESDVLGSFDFYTCIVCLDSVDKAGYEEFLNSIVTKNYAVRSKILPLAAHEFTHFIDTTSTLWGFKHLQKMDEAYASNNRNGGKENDFYKAKLFFDHVRSLRLPKYYTLIDEKKSSSRPWRYRITIGQQFQLDGRISDAPILFSWFQNSQNQPIARSPVSAVSILEASAMSNELLMKIRLIEDLPDNQKTVERMVYERESLSYIYNQNMTEYSVCVHIVANHLQCKDLLIAFSICSIITRIVLNFPKSLISRILDSDICKILNLEVGHEFARKIKMGIERHDLGVLYYLICSALPKESAENYSKVQEGIGIALSRLGLSLEEIKSAAELEANELVNRLSNSKFKSIVALSTAGLENFRRISFKNTSLPFWELSFPKIYLGDGSEVSIFENPNNLLKKISIEDVFEELNEGQEWVERFSEACIA